MFTKKIELIVEATNDIYPDRINEDLNFYYKRMYDRHRGNQTDWNVVECNISDVTP